MADRSAATPKKKRFAWVGQLRQAYTLGRKGDPILGWVLLAVFVVTWAVMIVIGLLLGSWLFWTLIGFALAAAATMFVFGRRVERSVYKQVEGTPGASMQALSALRRGFVVTPEPVAVNRSQDLVLRLIGKCGVVLVGEGAPSRVQGLLAAERRRHARVLGDLPIHEIQAGSAEGQVPIRKLTRTIMKLPKTLSGAQMTEMENRLKALSVGQSPIPIPKGPLPKGVKIPRAPRA
jgi:hypothetical protein